MLFVVFILVMVVVMTAKKNRHDAALAERQRCRACGASSVPHANFCGQCGRAL